MMDLYALGFNAHNQLHPTISNDLTTFTKVLSAPSIRIRLVLWSATIIEVPGTLLHRGYHPSGQSEISITGLPPEQICQLFGDTSGLLGAISTSGDLYLAHSIPALSTPGRKPSLQLRPHTFAPSNLLSQANPKRRIIHLATAENGQTCICTSTGQEEPTLHLFSSLSSLLNSPSPPLISHPLPTPPLQLLASSTSFLLLLPRPYGILSFGSQLHPAILGRVPTPSSPADVPSAIPFFGGVPLRKVACGGWNGAAVGEDGGLYAWGGRRGKQRVLGGEDGEVGMVDLGGEDGCDVVDIGVGEHGVLAMGERGEVWGCGAYRGRAGEWRAVNGPWVREAVGKVVAVEEGGWGTFVVVERGEG